MHCKRKISRADAPPPQGKRVAGGGRRKRCEQLWCTWGSCKPCTANAKSAALMLLFFHPQHPESLCEGAATKEDGQHVEIQHSAKGFLKDVGFWASPPPLLLRRNRWVGLRNVQLHKAKSVVIGPVLSEGAQKGKHWHALLGGRQEKAEKELSQRQFPGYKTPG